MEFAYVAANYTGTRLKGRIKANSSKEVSDYLRSNNLTPLRVSAVEGKSFLQNFNINKVGHQDIIVLTRQLASMVQTGLTLLESLNILKKQANKPEMQNILDDVIAAISEGKTFSDALQNHREHFSEVYIQLIKAAETSGLLDKVLARLADNLERSDDIKKQIRSAMFYPAIVLLIVFGVLYLMNTQVIPQLGALYEGLGAELPPTTKFVLGMSKVFTSYSFVIIPSVIGTVVGYKRFIKTKYGRRLLDQIKLKIPIVGDIVTLGILDEIARTLSLLISSGSSILDALGISAKVAGNVIYQEAMTKTSEMVERGVPLSTSMEHQNLFPVMLIQMTRVGESTGKIDDALLRLSGYFERDMNLKVKGMTTVIEPLLIIVLAVVVGFLIISIIAPIYGIITQIA